MAPCLSFSGAISLQFYVEEVCFVCGRLVFVCRYHLNHIQREDRELLWEGVDALTHDELVEACKDRAMMFYNISDQDMREEVRKSEGKNPIHSLLFFSYRH